MTKYLDKSKVERAFKRAARAATSNDKDARAGRFITQRDRAKVGTSTGKAPRKGK
jgi:hypothetical protein